MNSELKAVCHCAAAIVHLRCMLWLFVPQFQRIINESPFFLIFSKSQNHNSLTPCGRWWWWFEDPEPKSLCRLHLWDRSSINQAKHEIMLDCVIAFLIVQCSKNGKKSLKKELLDNYSAIWFSLRITPLPNYKQEHLQITALFADFIVPNLVICCWSKSLQEWGTHNFSSSFWQKKNSQRISILCPLFLRYNNNTWESYAPFSYFIFSRFFFFLHFFSSRNSRTRQINRDHYGSTPYHSSHVRLEKKVDIRWKELFLGERRAAIEYIVVVRFEILQSSKHRIV